MKFFRVSMKIISILLTAILGVILVCNLYTIAVRAITGRLQPTVFGFSAAVVISGSMHDAIEIDDMILIHKEKDYAVGDVITFQSEGNLVTHRIVAQTAEGFITKGDANNAPDRDPVAPQNVVGRVILAIPRVGTVISFLRTPLGMTALVLVGFALIEVPVLLRRRLEEKEADSHVEHQTESQGRSPR